MKPPASTAQTSLLSQPKDEDCLAFGPSPARGVAVESDPANEATRMSDWSKVTRPIPVPNEWTKPFWDAARRGALELQRCQKCGHFQHPPYATCVNCVSTDLKFEPVRGAGAIYAYTIMYHTGDKRFAAAVPYASIIVELDDAPGALMAGNLLRRALHRSQGRAARRGRLRDAERRHHAAAVPARARVKETRHVGKPVQGGDQRRGLLQGQPLGRDPARRARAGGGQGGGRGLRPADGGHRWPRDLSGAAGDRARGGRRHLRRLGQLHDGDAEAAEPDLAHPGRHDQYRRRAAAGGQRAARGRLQICRRLAGDAQPARHLPEPARHPGAGRHPVHRALRLRRAGPGHGGRLYPLARAEQPEPREDGHPRRDTAPPHAAQPARLFLRHAADGRGLFRVPHGRLSLLPLRLRHPGARRRRRRADPGGPGARPEADAGLPRRLRPAAAFRGGRAASAACPATWRAGAARPS